MHKNKRRKYDDSESNNPLIQFEHNPTIHEVSLNYIKDGHPPLYKQCIDMAHQVDSILLHWELDRANNPDQIRYHKFLDQFQSCAVSVASNLAHAIGHTPHGLNSVKSIRYASGSLTECLVWLEFFPQDIQDQIYPLLTSLKANFDQFMMSEYETSQRSKGKSGSDTEYDIGYLRVKVPQVITDIIRWAAKVHKELGQYTDKLVKGNTWGKYYHYKHQIEELSFALASAPANMMEGWGRCGCKMNWNYLRCGRAAMFKMLPPLVILQDEISSSLLEEREQLMIQLDMYVEEVIESIIQNKRPRFITENLTSSEQIVTE
jgi:four helix bundle protein